MSKTIDQKVVEMRFDNKHFESNVQTTMSTLDKLKQKLNLDGASKGLDNINTSANKINMSGLSNALTTVQAKFSALEVMGVTALANLTNSAVNVGKRIAAALTIDPIKSGFQEYETQINSVQTILANTESKGTTLQDVNRALDELNTYADKTIYNFTEMTRNIGTFTAAGVDLETSVSSIKGIANLAAVSGSSSQQASTAMYQLSQALAAGRVSLMDWNSVVNAGMGGQVFQDALKRTAENMGKDVDGMIKKYGSFRESLTQGEWLTTEVLTKTLEQFTMSAEEGSEAWENYKKSLMKQGYTEKQAIEILKMANTATDAATKVKTFTQLWDTLKESAQSGWTQTWEIIIGDFGEAKEFLTNISDTIGGMINASSEARNNLLAGGLTSGWKQLLGAGIADEAGFKETLNKVAKDNGFAFEELIKQTEKDGGTYEDALKKALSEGSIDANTLTTSVSKLSEKMQGMSAKQREAAGYTQEHIQQIKELDEGLKNGSISMDEFVSKIMRPSGRENLIQALSNSFTGIMNIIKPIKEAFREIFPRTTSEQLYNITENVRDLTARFAAFTEKYGPQIKSTFKGVFAVLDIGVTIIKEVAGGIIDIAGSLLGFTGGILSGTASLGDWLSKIRDSIKQSGVFGKTIDFVVGIIQKAIDKVKEFSKALGEKISIPGFEGIFKVLTGIWNVIKKLGSQIGEAFTEALRSGDINAALEVFNTGIFGTILLGISKFMNKATKVFDDAKGIFGNLKDTLGELKGVLEAYQQNLKANVLIKIAGAIGILAAAIVVLAMIKPERLDQAVGSMALLFTELMAALAIFTKISSNIKHTLRASVALIALSEAMLILAVSMKILSTLSWNEIGRGLTGVAGGLAALVITVNLLPEKKVMGGARAIKKLSTSLVIFALAMKIMATMSWSEIGRGLAGVAGGLAALVIAVNLLPKTTGIRTAGMVGLATSLVILGGALKIMATMSWKDIGRGLTAMSGALAALVIAVNLLPKTTGIRTLGMMGLATSLIVLGGALKLMATMSWEEIGRGLTVMGVALAELAIALNLMKGTLLGSASLIIAAGAIAILTPAIMLLSQLSLPKIGKGLLALGGALAVLGIAGLLLKPVIPALLGLGASVALVGVGATALGVGLGLIAAGITALALAIASGATAIVAGLSAIIIGTLGLIPDIAKVLGELVLVVCDVLIKCAPKIAETIYTVLSEVLATMATKLPGIIDSVMSILLTILRGIRDYLPQLIVVAVEIIGAFFEGIVDALSGIDTTNLLKGIVGVGLLTALMYALSGVVGLIPGAMIGILGMGVIIAEMALVLAAIGALSKIPGLSWLIKEGGNFLEKIGTAIGQFLGGIIGGVAKGATSALPEIGKDLSDFVTNAMPFINTSSKIDPSMMKGIKALAEAVLILSAANILDGIAKLMGADNSLADFGEEISEFGVSLKEFEKATKDIDAEHVKTAAEATKALVEIADAVPNSGGLLGKITGENDLGDFGDEIADYGEELAEFSESISDLDQEDIEKVKLSAQAAKEMIKVAKEVPNSGGLVAMITGDNSLADFGDEMEDFGDELAKYNENIKGIDPDLIKNSGTATKELIKMVKTFDGGLIDKLTGEKNLGSFASNLVTFGQNLVKYSKEVVGLNTESITISIEAATGLVELATALNPEGGWLQGITGTKDLANFAKDLAVFGPELVKYGDTVVGVNTESIKGSVEAAKGIVAIAVALNKSQQMSLTSGFATFAEELVKFGVCLRLYSFAVNGLNNKAIALSAKGIEDVARIAALLNKSQEDCESVSGFASFAKTLVEFGTNLRLYSLAVSGLNNEAIAASATGAKYLTDVVHSLPESSGLKSIFTGGGKNLASFALQLIPFGYGLKAYSQAVSGLSLEAIKTSVEATTEILGIYDLIPEKKGVFDSLLKGKQGNFARKLVPIAESIKEYADIASSINIEAIRSSEEAFIRIGRMLGNIDKLNVDNIESFNKAINALDGLNIDNLIKAFSDTGGKVKAAGSNIVMDLVKGIRAKQSDITLAFNTVINKVVSGVSSIMLKTRFMNAGSTLMKYMATGIKLSTIKVSSAMKNIIQAANVTVKSSYNGFYNSGKYVVDGFAKGITSNSYKAKLASAAMAKESLNAAKKALGIASPSKEFYKTGDFAGVGFVNALLDGADRTYSAGYEMADSARQGLSKAVSKIADVINNDIDAQPTIRPVLDLSDVENGASYLNTMFNNGPSLGVSTNLNAIGSAMNKQNQNGVNSEVIQAINNLRKDLGNVGGNTYNINGVAYADTDTDINNAVRTLVRAAKVERRI